MKKKILSLALIFAMAVGITTSTRAFQTPAHTKKDGTADKRFKDNKTPKGPLTKSGKPDMRHKANNPNAGKKKKA
ncbi:MAG: hypothetical protein V4560_07650 [Bacteroidota bacterium]|jgi:hypothetical protein